MKKIGLFCLLGIAVAFGGMLFSELFGAVFNGMGWDTGRIMGMGAYLCIVLVVCTGVILSKLDK